MDLGKTKKPIEIVDDDYTVMPCDCKKGSPYGDTRGRVVPHRGVDLLNSPGTPIRAAKRGEVVFAGWHKGYGETVVLQHSKGHLSVYAHLQKNSISVKVGQQLKAGDILGRMGATGDWQEGVHLHFHVMNPALKPISDMRLHIQSYYTIDPFSKW